VPRLRSTTARSLRRRVSGLRVCKLVKKMAKPLRSRWLPNEDNSPVSEKNVPWYPRLHDLRCVKDGIARPLLRAIIDHWFIFLAPVSGRSARVFGFVLR